MSAETSPSAVIASEAVQAAAHYFRDLSQETFTRREVIDLLDYLAREHAISPGKADS